MYYVLIVFLFPRGSNGANNSFEIFRSEHDIFTNLQCRGDECTESHCQIFGANCVSDGNCKYCVCNKRGMNTFVRNETDPTKGECKRDEEIVPESVPNERFLIQRQEYHECIKAQQNGSVMRTSCSWPTLDMLWIWTNTQDALLMNIKTLKCMSGNLHHGGRSDRPANVSVQPCHGNFNSQKMTCFSNKNRTRTTIGWNRWTMNARHERSRRFLQLNNKNQVVASLFYSQLWNNRKHACVTKTTYKGCYRFSDGSFLKYLDYNKTNATLQISAPIFQNNSNTCRVKQSFQFIRDGQKWELNEQSILFSIDNKLDGKYETKKFLQFTTTEQLKACNGSLLKLFVKCANEEHCVLLKLESYPRYLDDTKYVNHPTSPVCCWTNSTEFAIAVSGTLLVILLLALGCFLCYRRRKRHDQASSQKDSPQNRGEYPQSIMNNTAIALNSLQPSTSDQPTQSVSQQFEVPCEHPYECVNKTAFTSPKTFTYDYASMDGLLRNGQQNVTERPNTEKVATYNGSYVIERSDRDEGDTQDGGYVIENPDTEKGGPHVPPQIPRYELSSYYQYEYPDQSQSHQYEYPSLKNEKPDITGDKDVCEEELGYSPLARLLLKKNKSENRDYTSLIKDPTGSEKVGNTAKKDKADGLSCVEALGSHYTPLVRPPLKSNESEDSCYTSLIKNEKTSKKAVTTSKKNYADGLLCLHAMDDHYTPLVRPPLKDNEIEASQYEPLLKNGQKTRKKPMQPEKQNK